jgi:hypothetical protein
VSEKQRPVAEVSVGPIHAAIWRNENQGEPFYNTSFEARYKDGQGEWKTTKSFSQMDLLALAKCADLAYDKIAALKSKDSEPSSPG